jgi:hypothetical protein
MKYNKSIKKRGTWLLKYVHLSKSIPGTEKGCDMNTKPVVSSLFLSVLWPASFGTHPSCSLSEAEVNPCSQQQPPVWSFASLTAVWHERSPSELHPLQRHLYVRRLHVKIHFVPQRKHNVSITKINWLMLFKEIIHVFFENHMKSVNIYRVYSAELSIVLHC